MSETNRSASRKLPLHWKMLIGFLVGLVAGLVVHYTVGGDAGWVKVLTTYVTQPAATIFLRLIFMLVIPLLFAALVIGVAEMGDIRSFGRVGWRTLAYTVVMSALAVVLGLVLVNLFKPGAGVDEAQALKLLSDNAERARSIVSSAGRAAQGHRHAAVDRPGQHRRRRVEQQHHPVGDVLRVDARHRPGDHPQRGDRDAQARHPGAVRRLDGADRHGDQARALRRWRA
jgi:hypothetical protein